MRQLEITNHYEKKTIILLVNITSFLQASEEPADKLFKK